MKLFQMLTAVFLLAIASSALGGLRFVNLDNEDLVNGKNFTVVVEADDYEYCDALFLTFTSTTTALKKLNVSSPYLNASGLIADPGLSVVNEVTGEIGYSRTHPFTVAFKVEGVEKGERVLLEVRIYNASTHETKSAKMWVNTA